LAEDFAGALGFELFARFSQGSGGGGNPLLPFRTKFFDNFLMRCTTTEGLRQVVLLGAGFDSRAFRLDWPQGTVVFEIDQASVFHEKDHVLDDLDITPDCDRRVVAADLSQPWHNQLLDAGFDKSTPTAWVAEGLLMYFSEEYARAIMGSAAHLSARESRIGADMISRSVHTAANLQAHLEKLSEAGMPWDFSTDTPETFLDTCGWHADVVVQPGEPGAAFRELEWPPVPRSVVDHPRSFFIAATRNA
jgi:methyltransferase (TIGR00027 family)